MASPGVSVDQQHTEVGDHRLRPCNCAPGGSKRCLIVLSAVRMTEPVLMIYLPRNLTSRFFQTRNPHIGLLDPDLHTPKYVRHTSFTLFSVICALGCAISTRPRDRILYPTLLSLAEANLAWSIAVPVRSLETIQAILAMKYWAPMYQRQGDDPHWLHISHVRSRRTNPK